MSKATQYQNEIRKNIVIRQPWIDAIVAGTAKDHKKLVAHGEQIGVGTKLALESKTVPELVKLLQKALASPPLPAPQVRSVNEIFQTSGDGTFTLDEVAIEVTSLELIRYTASTGELRVYVAAADAANVEGEIYGDKGFLADTKDYLKRAGYVGNIAYAPLGVQGDNYVSFIVNGSFFKSWDSVKPKTKRNK